MMDAIIDRTLERFVLEGCISRENADIYRFGLECMFLKAVHYVSYFLIALLFHSAGSLLISACIFAPLRSRIGGYHAKTRMRCYVFSCFMILLLCLLNRYQIPEPALFCGLLSADMIIYLLAPAADENNESRAGTIEMIMVITQTMRYQELRKGTGCHGSKKYSRSIK